METPVTADPEPAAAHPTTDLSDPFAARHSLRPALQAVVDETKQRIDARRRRTARLLVILEGGYDVSFLKRISGILHADDPQVLDLRSLEQAGAIVFVPVGGSNFIYWTDRLSGLGIPEYFILDREISPLTEERLQAADIVNSRAGCRAVLTGKRAAENYLHRETLRESRGLELAFGDCDDVPQLVARSLLERDGGPGWSALPSRSRRRLKDRAKRWLNTDAVSRMTPERLAERDPQGDVRSWLTAIGEMSR